MTTVANVLQSLLDHQKHSPRSLNMSQVATIILSGGQGSRLFPLTQHRCKPAVSFGGRYRLIDVPISNAINSGCNQIFILTQFLSSSLHQHIFKTYRHDLFTSGFLEILSAEQRPSQQTWYEGTADAVRQNIEHISDTSADYFLILSGDQLYNMNFQAMMHFALTTDADLVIASLRVSKQDAKRLGILKIDQDHFVTDFHEKPQEDELLKNLALPDQKDPERSWLGSMGIYLFKRDTLLRLLKEDMREDFGKHLIPTQLQAGKVAAYQHQGYWEDIGTIHSFYQANMALTSQSPLFDCYDEKWPIFSHRHHLPAPKIFNTRISNSIICEGSVVEAKEITNSLLGPRTVIKAGCTIHNSYFLGNDYYSPPNKTQMISSPIYVGEDSTIQKAIIDNHVHIGKGVRLVNWQNLDHYDGEHVYIRDGIIVVPRGKILPDGFTL